MSSIDLEVYEEKMKDSLISTDQSIHDVDHENRTMFQRYFSPMKEGSLRGAIFALLASAMGTGIFNLPLRIKQIGLIPFIIFILTATFFSKAGMSFMIKLIKQKKYKSYSEMAFSAYGKPLMRVAQFCNIIYPWGITICYQVILAKFVCQLLNDELNLNLYKDKEDTEYTHAGNMYRIFIHISCLVFSTLLAMKKKIDMIQKISIIGVFSVIFNVICITFTSFIGFTRADDHFHSYRGILHVDWSKVNWWNTKDLDAVSVLCQGFAAMIFCFVNHQLLFPLSATLKRPSKKRFSKIINRSHLVECASYMLVGTMAYLLLLQHEDIHPIAPMVITSISTPPLIFGKALMAVALFFAIPLNTFPARQSLFEALKLERNNRNHIIVTMSLVWSSCLFAIFFQSVNSYFGLLGGTAGVLMAAGIPALSYFKLASKLEKVQKFILGAIAFMTIFCLSGAILSIIDPA